MNTIRRAITVKHQLSYRKDLLSLFQRSQSISSSANPRNVYSTTRLKTHNPKPAPSEPTVSEQPSPPPPPPPNVAPREQVNWPRPSEIPFQEKVMNSVNLIGKVKVPVQLEATSDGNFCARTIILVSTSNNSPPPFWIQVLFKGDLAHVAASHLQEGDYVHVAGNFCVDAPQVKLIEGQVNVQVLVHSVNFVAGSPQSSQGVVPCKEECAIKPFTKPSASVRNNNALNSWRDLLNNPKEWNDCRERKRSGSVKPNYPDFKHKHNGLALWLNSAPQWALAATGGLQFEVPRENVQKAKEDRDTFPLLKIR